MYSKLLRLSIVGVLVAAFVQVPWTLKTLGQAGLAPPGEGTWSSPFPQLDGDVMALADDGRRLYAGGYFRRAGDERVNHVAMWDGVHWHRLGEGVNQAVLALAVDDDGVVYAAGHFSEAGGQTAGYVAKWDGSSWTPLGTGMNSIVYTLAFAADGTLYAGGAFTRAGGVEANYIAAWKDGQWTGLGSGMDHHVLALAPRPDGGLYAAGGFSMAGGQTAHQAALWNGSFWQPLGSGLHPPFAARPVLALALTPGGILYAGGNFDAAGDEDAAFLARWDGVRWSRVGEGIDGGVHVLAASNDGVLYAGGYFRRAGHVQAGHVARWQAGTWSILGSGTGGLVHSIAIGANGMLHVGGSFDSAGGIAADRLACYVDAVQTSAGVERPPVAEAGIDKVYPNPVVGSAAVRFTLPQSRFVDVKLFDLLGRERAVLTSGFKSAGTHEAQVASSPWPAGVYFIVLQAGDLKSVRKVVVAR